MTSLRNWLKLKKLDLYLGRTVAVMILLTSAGLISLFTVFTFLDQVGDMENDYTLLRVIQYLLLSMPRMFYETLPYAVLIGCLAGLGALANNSELIVMRSAGVSTWHIAMAALRPALVFVIIGVLIGETVLPDFERTARVNRKNAMEDDPTPVGGFWYREGNRYLNFSNVSYEGELTDITQYFLSDKGELIESVWAASGSYVESAAPPYWEFRNVIITRLVDPLENALLKITNQGTEDR